MNVDNAFIQKHLTQRMRRGLKRLSPALELTSGAVLSIQASATHYCTPKSNTGPYVSVEVGHTGLKKKAVKRLNKIDPSGWVSVATIVEIINDEGGINNSEQADLDAYYGDKP